MSLEKKELTRKWAVLAVVTLVSFVTNLDATIVVIGLPRLLQDLHVSMVTGMWSITAYLIMSTVFLLPAGKWADSAGYKRIFLWGFGLFTAATLLCGLANSGHELILFRLIQGIGAAFALATASPILMRVFPAEQLGLAIGINSTSWVIGSIVGPVAGGALISLFGWRSMFFVQVPFALLGLVAGWILLKEMKGTLREKTDWAGVLTFGLGLTAFLVALSEGQDWGWATPAVLGLFGATLLFLTAFVFVEWRAKQPLLQLRLFSFKTYTTGLGVTFSYCVGYFSITTLLTFYLQSAQHLSPLESGLLLIPLSAPQLVMGPLGGKFADRFGPFRMAGIGLCLIAGSFFLLGNLGESLKQATVIVPLFIISVANGLAWPSVAKSVLSAAPAEQAGSASGMFYTIYNVGRVVSQTLALIIVEVYAAPAYAKPAVVQMTDIGFRMFAVFFLIALALVYFMKRAF